MAAASVGKPACTKSSTARVIGASIISIAAGTMPAAMIALTVAAPSSTRSKSSSSVRTAGGFGVSRTPMRVAMPSMPSPPTNAPRRSSPAGSGSSPAEHGDRAVGQHHLDGQRRGCW